MDALMQTKLSKSEWDSTEIPVSDNEKQILELIRSGYHDTNIKQNFTCNLHRFTKIDMKPEVEFHLYTKYFKDIVNKIIKKYCKEDEAFQEFVSNAMKIKKLKSAEVIRLQNVDNSVQTNSEAIFEFVLLELCRKICRGVKHESDDFHPLLYSLIHCRSQCTDTLIPYTNPYVLEFVDLVIAKGKEDISVEECISHIPNMLEKNKYLSKYRNLALYPHQKELFTVCRTQRHHPKLIFYTAPTGTGKTLSPIGLSEDYCVLFVCVGRHIGLALAKSAVSIGKRVAFAFGCDSASDIRLHYFAAADYTVNKRSGRIAKVDNSNGSKVEIMICDIQSYLVAMYYMMAFNDRTNIITYWDEPTMTLDYESHELHGSIGKLWKENQIPNMVLSCATLPTTEEIPGIVVDFRGKFGDVYTHTITSADYTKTIPIIDTNGHAFLPHTHYEDSEEIQNVASYCTDHKTLMRYFDLEGIMNFIKIVYYLESKNPGNVIDSNYVFSEYFDNIEDITMSSVKEYYLALLQNINASKWPSIKSFLKKAIKPKFNYTVHNSALRRIQSVSSTISPMNNEIKRTASDTDMIVQNNINDPLKGIRLTTNDAHSLTDGPTIYFADNVLNVARLYVNQSSIPKNVLNHILESIDHNEKLRESIEKLEADLFTRTQVKDNQDKSTEESSKKSPSKKLKEKDNDKDPISENLEENIRQLRRQIRILSLHADFIPNTTSHQEKWTPDGTVHPNAFVSNISTDTVKEIMSLDVDQSYKVLVLMGIGVLVKMNEPKYEEIVKRLAQEQKLFLIITSTDYIYGTNYQFCHGFVGKDLQKMTQQKTIQCMGRIGRNASQQTYTVRFRNDDMIKRLFCVPEVNLEAINMNRIFCSD